VGKEDSTNEEATAHTRAGDPAWPRARSSPERRPIDEVVRHLETLKSTWHRCRNQCWGMKDDDAMDPQRSAQGELNPELVRRTNSVTPCPC
jgi:hypothetical protein